MCRASVRRGRDARARRPGRRVRHDPNPLEPRRASCPEPYDVGWNWWRAQNGLSPAQEPTHAINHRRPSAHPETARGAHRRPVHQTGSRHGRPTVTDARTGRLGVSRFPQGSCGSGHGRSRRGTNQDGIPQPGVRMSAKQCACPSAIPWDELGVIGVDLHPREATTGRPGRGKQGHEHPEHHVHGVGHKWVIADPQPALQARQSRMGQPDGLAHPTMPLLGPPCMGSMMPANPAPSSPAPIGVSGKPPRRSPVWPFCLPSVRCTDCRYLSLIL